MSYNLVWVELEDPGPSNDNLVIRTLDGNNGQRYKSGACSQSEHHCVLPALVECLVGVK